MWFWWFMLISSLLIPALMITAGWFMWKRPPKKINSAIGYRTSRSMKNINTWQFAHHYCGQLWWKIGWIMLLPSFVIYLPFYSGSENTIGIIGSILVTLQCAVLILSIVPTELALKRSFTNDGTPKTVLKEK